MHKSMPAAIAWRALKEGVINRGGVAESRKKQGHMHTLTPHLKNTPTTFQRYYGFGGGRGPRTDPHPHRSPPQYDLITLPFGTNVKLRCEHAQQRVHIVGLKDAAHLDRKSVV